MIQIFRQEPAQILMLMLNGVASVGIAIAVATAISTAHATAAKLAKMGASGNPEVSTDSSAAAHARTPSVYAADAGVCTSGNARGQRRDPG